MASSYPATKQTFTNPLGTQTLDVPDHALMHGTTNDTLGSIQDTVGTTAGTNVLMSFAAGQFPVRNTGGGATGTLVQTIVGGTHNNTTIGTSAITGGTVNSVTIGTPAITGGTVNNAVFGTQNSTGGTIRTAVVNNSTIGTPAITSGTITSAVLNSPTSASGSALPGALQGMLTNSSTGGSATGTTPVVAVAGTFTTTQTANIFVMASGAWYQTAAVQNIGSIFFNGTAITSTNEIVDDFAAANQGRTFAGAGTFSNFSGVGTVSFRYSVGGAGTAVIYGARINALIFNA